MVYGLALISVVVPFLVFGFGRRGAWASAALVGLFLVAYGVGAALARRRTRRAFEVGRCTRCGYDTRASSGRCPECGDELISHAAEYWRGLLRY